MSYALGVDLGTTFTAVATGRPGRVEMVSLGTRSVVIPSVAFASHDGQLLTGDAADRRAERQPDRAAREFKRRLGDPTPLLLGGTPYSPASLMAAALRDAVDAVAQMEGDAPERIVLSRPAVWGPYRLEQFDQVQRLAGLADVNVVTEPLAAATYYTSARTLTDGDVIAVYDLGGGTFDSAVLLFESGEMRILGTPEGVEWLGGTDFDEAILRYVDGELGGAVTAAGPEDAVALARLRQDCVLAKEALSFDDETVIQVFLGSARQHVRLHRARFEEMIRPAVVATIEGLQRALRSAEIRPVDLSAVLLAGGSSRIPLIARTIESSFGRPTVVDTHPKHVVALGAAHIAAASLFPPAPATAAVTATAAPTASAAAATAATAPAAVPAAEQGRGAPADWSEDTVVLAGRDAGSPGSTAGPVDGAVAEPGPVHGTATHGPTSETTAGGGMAGVEDRASTETAGDRTRADGTVDGTTVDGTGAAGAPDGSAGAAVEDPGAFAESTASDDSTVPGGTDSDGGLSSPWPRHRRPTTPPSAPTPPSRAEAADEPPAPAPVPTPDVPASAGTPTPVEEPAPAGRSGSGGDRPVLDRRDLVIALAISVIVLTVAVLIGVLYGYAHRTRAPDGGGATGAVVVLHRLS
ncbi:Hsp70 family protein [Frankia sp. Cpl3]|nr:Hsp70 family protein [Frankia sp. Cpl3]